MEGKLIYIGIPITTPSPIVQVTNGSKVVITSIRIANSQTNNRTYEIHHVARGETAATSANALAFNVQATSKTAAEFLTHPLPISPGESLWISGDGITFAIYGVVFP